VGGGQDVNGDQVPDVIIGDSSYRPQGDYFAGS
jgi:hypothetical protein